LIPFLWSAATHLSLGLAGWTGQYLSPMFLGAYVGLTYGTLILAFMAGALWGLAARADGPARRAMCLCPVGDPGAVGAFCHGHRCQRQLDDLS
jgi:hypothetical protein